MGDGKHRGFLKMSMNRALDLPVAFKVNIGGCFVHDDLTQKKKKRLEKNQGERSYLRSRAHQARVPKNGTGERYKLPFTDAKIFAVVSNRGFQSTRQHLDLILKLGRLQSMPNIDVFMLIERIEAWRPIKY